MNLSYADPLGFKIRLAHIQLHGDDPDRLALRNLTLFTRIFEAHFLPSHLTIIIVASSIDSSLNFPITTCRFVTHALKLTDCMLLISFFIMLFYFAFCYEEYHTTSVAARVSELAQTGLLEEAGMLRRRRWTLGALRDNLIFPVARIIAGAVPLIHASVCHFRSQRLVYTNAKKPGRKVGLAD